MPAANLVLERRRVVAAAPDELWPWLVQLGKKRAGWYLPRGLERLLPAGGRATWAIEPAWQSLAPGDRIPDYGGRDDYLEVVVLEAPKAIVYRTERRGTVFSWTLALQPLGPAHTLVSLRFRGRLRSTGWRRAALVRAGELFDRLTAELMLSGLQERIGAAAVPASWSRSSPSSDAERLSCIYLDDHIALLVVGEHLVRRTLRRADHPELLAALEQALSELRDDRGAAVALLAGLGRRPGLLKSRFAWVAERAGRLKLNGRLVSASPLSRVVELEGIEGLLGASWTLWRTLERTGPEAFREEAARRARRAEGRVLELEAFRLAAGDLAFGPGAR
ncbi:MAG TPA: hypothetical protein VLK36_06900 [Gaiellaceae bacterium]|nr:hypothetical protein [Gaiellaceae bacterium]